MFSRLPPHGCSALKFGISTNTSVTTYSAVEVSSAKLSDSSNSQQNTLFDPRMGVDSDSNACLTCGNNQKKCPKHYGHISLSVPMINPQRQLFGKLMLWLRCICFRCGSIMFDPREVFSQWNQWSPHNRLIAMAKELKGISVSEKSLGKVDFNKLPKCPNCSMIHPCLMTKTTVYRSQIYMYVIDAGGKNVTEVPLTPVLVEQILNQLRMEVVTGVFGFSSSAHPRNCIKNVIEVVPGNLRSSQTNSSAGQQRTDTITVNLKYLLEMTNTLSAYKEVFREKINDILNMSPAELKARNNIINPPKVPKNAIKDPASKSLLNMINTQSNVYYQLLTGTKTETNKYSTAPNQGDNMSISKYLQGKHGLVRHAGLGTRNHNRARAVIRNEPGIRVDEVFMPLFIMKRLERVDIVTEFNYAELRQMIINGKNIYPGAFMVEKRSGEQYYTDKMSDSTRFDLQLGDKVHRMMKEGEFITITRQPSTRLTNIGTHRIRINYDPNAFAVGINGEVCGLYAADFDGDQMTILASTSMAAIVESSILSNVSNNFISDQKSNPAIGLSQDSVSLMAMMTRSSVRMSRYEAMIVSAGVSSLSVKLTFNKASYTGREVVSMCLPSIRYKRNSTIGASTFAPYIGIQDDEVVVEIVDGKIISGVLDKATVSATKGSIFDAIYAKYGVDKAIQTIFNLQQLALTFGRLFSFTISPRDFLIRNKEARGDIQHYVNGIIQDADLLLQNYRSGSITAPTDKDLDSHVEDKLVAVMKIELVKPVGVALRGSNLIIMISCGAKGSPTHMFSVAVCIGMALVDGRMLPRNFDYKRTCIYNQRCDVSPQSRGFIPDCFAEGIDPLSYFNSARESRSTIIKKAISTAIAGAMSRLLVRNTESLKINYWHAVVCNKKIIQWVFGDHNFNPSKVFEYPIPGIKLSDAAFEKQYLDADFPETFQEMLNERNAYRANMIAMEQMFGNNLFSVVQRFPMNIEDYVSSMDNSSTESTDDVRVMLKRVRALIEWFPRSTFNDNMTYDALPMHFRNVYTHMQMYTRLCLAPHVLRRMKMADLEGLIRLIRAKFLGALIEPEAPIGIKTSTATSEPITQQQLSATHATGDARLSAYSLKGINYHINAADTTTNGSAIMWMLLEPEIENNRARAEEIANYIQIVPFSEFVTQAHIFYEAYGSPQHSKFVHEKRVYEAFERAAGKPQVATLSNYCIRFELSRRKLLAKDMSIEDIVVKLYEQLPEVFIVYNYMNDSHPLVIRIHLERNLFRTSFADQAQRRLGVTKRLGEFVDTIMGLSVRGISGIREAFVMPISIASRAPDGSIVDRKVLSIRTRGSNIIGLAGVSGIAKHTINTSSMHESMRIYGLPYTRAKIAQEWGKILNDFIWSYFYLLTDTMLSTTRITPLNKKGNMTRESQNILLNVATGSAMSILTSAALNETTSDVYGLSTPVLLGQRGTMGTGSIEVAYDHQLARTLMPSTEKMLDRF